MAACGPGNSCRGNNECCCGLYGNNYNKCGTTVSFCNQYSIQNLCGPCTTSNCFDIPVQFQQFPGSFQCPQQVHEYKDCRLTNWSSCNNERRTITITRDAITGGSLNGVACPDPTNLIQTCNNCIISDWTACINRTRTRTRTQSINSTACTIEQNALSLTQTCNNCIISDWTACTVSEGDSRVCLYKTDCTNRTRTRTITQSINSTACTLEENALPVTQTCNDCEVSEWIGTCINRTRTKATIPPINGGLACPDSTSLIQTCNNCIVSDWTACINRTRTRKRTQSINSTACTLEENALSVTQTCNNCEVSEWTACVNRTRTRTRTQSINSTACTLEENALSLTQTCNNCIISDWTSCNGNNKIKTRKRTYAINGGTACTPEENKLLLNEDCYNCKIGQWANWSVWSECDCKTKTITRTKKVINNNSNCDLIQTQNCSNNEKCLKLECGAQNKYYNLQTKKCNNKNIFNYIINLFNLIILFIMNLFKFS